MKYAPWQQIELYGSEALSKKCPEVECLSDEDTMFIEDMVQTMYAAKGVGLAAPQVGSTLRVVVMDCSKDGTGLKKLVNPQICASRGRVQSKEGCLSFPGLELHVTRAKEVDVEALAPSGEVIKFTANGLEAICIQHEIDHLDGITFEQRVSRQVRRHAFRKWDLDKEVEKLVNLGSY